MGLAPVGGVTAHLGDDPSWSERMTSHTGTGDTVQTPTEAAVGNIAQWAQSLMQPCRVYEEGLRVVKYFQREEGSKVNTFAH